MPPQETPSKESPDPINVLISIIKPGWKRAVFLILPILGLMTVHFIYYSDPPSACINIIRLFLSAFTVTYIGVSIGEAYKKKSDIVDSFQKNQPQFFTIIVVLGGALAILIPMIMNVTKLIGDGAPLTTALLGITGGVIAIFGYYKTHQKSELEKEQLDIQKQKDKRDYIRQLHDSYNDRFDKAVTELHGADVKAAYTAVPKLAKLADAWLDYEDLSNNTEELEKLKKKAKKEAQTIINILCKYIQTIPNNYTDEQLEKFDSLSESDKKALAHEVDIRLLIFSEMSDRLSKSTAENGAISTIHNIWNEFTFNFNRAPIFYPLYNITFKNTNFSEAKFYNAEFSNSFFNGDTRFDSAVFEGKSDFTYISFNGNINLDNSEFTGETTFKHINFSQNLSCIGGTFHGGLKIKDSSIIGDAYFNDSTFEFLEVSDTTFRRKADFTASESQTTCFHRTIFYNEAIFKKMTFGISLLQLVTFQNSANFQDVTFTDIASFSSTKFKNNTNFMNAEFYKSAGFNYITFTGPASFVNSTFNDVANFSGATFKDKSFFTEINFYGDANFEGSTFEGNTSFNESLFDKKADFTSSNFRGKSEFIKTTYNQGASFINSQFAASPPLFSGYIYNNTKEDWFNYESIFSELVDPKNYIFDISPESQQKLETKKIRFNENIFVLPVGGDLYDPECPPIWDDEDIY